MRRILNIVSITAVIATLGCMKMKVTDSSSQGGGDVFSSGYSGKPTTDLSVCSTGFPATSPFGRWKMSFTEDDLDLTAFFEFSTNGRTLAVNRCAHNGQTAQAQTSVQTFIFTDRHLIQFNESAQSSADGTDGMKCGVAVSAQTLSYSFDGACLKVKPASQSTSYTLVPATN